MTNHTKPPSTAAPAVNLSTTSHTGRILAFMANATAAFVNPNAPTLERVRALIALMIQLICNPSRLGEVAAMCAEAEALLARRLFDQLIEQTGREELRSFYEPVMRQRGGRLEFSLRERPGALHPFHQIILATRRQRAFHRYGTALGARHRGPSRPTSIRRHNHLRRQRVIRSRSRATRAAPSHTPARIDAPP